MRLTSLNKYIFKEASRQECYTIFQTILNVCNIFIRPFFNLLPQFCFPNNITAHLIGTDKESFCMLYDSLITDIRADKKHYCTFLFKDEQNEAHHYYSFVLYFPEIVSVKDVGLVKLDKALCIMSHCLYSELFYAILDVYYEVYQRRILHINPINSAVEFYCKLIPNAIQTPQINHLFEIEVKAVTFDLLNIKFQESDSLAPFNVFLFKYNSKVQLREELSLYLNEKLRSKCVVSYYAPYVLSSMKLEHVFHIVSAILLEKSILFVSNQTFLLSAFK